MIRLTATFDPRGWMGRAYWYAILPVHALIFRGLLRQVARRARQETAPTHPPSFTYGSSVPPASLPLLFASIRKRIARSGLNVWSYVK